MSRQSWLIAALLMLGVVGCGEPFSTDSTIDTALVLDDELLQIDPGGSSQAGSVRSGGNGSLFFAIREWENVEPDQFRSVLRTATERGVRFQTARCLGEDVGSTVFIVQGTWYSDPYGSLVDYKLEAGELRTLISVSNDATPQSDPPTPVDLADMAPLQGDTCNDAELAELSDWVR